MKNIKQLLVGSTLAAALAVGGGTAAFAQDNTTTTPTPPAAEHEHGTHHDGEHKKHEGMKPLTDAQKQAIKDAGVDFKAMKESGHQLRETGKSIRETHQQLQEFVQNSNDQKLKAQVEADLKATESEMQKLHELRATNKDLRKQLHDAVQAADAAKIKEAYVKMEANRQQSLKLMQTIQASLQAELKKVKK